MACIVLWDSADFLSQGLSIIVYCALTVPLLGVLGIAFMFEGSWPCVKSWWLRRNWSLLSEGFGNKPGGGARAPGQKLLHGECWEPWQSVVETGLDAVYPSLQCTISANHVPGPCVITGHPDQNLRLLGSERLCSEIPVCALHEGGP